MDGKQFRGNRRSEIAELREELQHASKSRRKDVIKKIIGAMTVGKDVSSLFPEVVNCIQTTNLELKKLVYLYVINYAKVQPELAILAVNTFCKDAKDRNPLIRALAVRTMGCIRLAAITEYLVEPLKRCYVDPDPYVRKTAATCIAKLYGTSSVGGVPTVAGISPQLVTEEGFIDVLEKMMSDRNPTVVANAVATLAEISELSEENHIGRILANNPSKLEGLLRALNECMEWGQVYILDALMLYKPTGPEDARTLIEGVIPRFSHINPAVVMSAMKVVVKMLPRINDKEYLRVLQGKLASPLVTLASLDPEIQYVALRSILVIIEKWPRLLEGNVRAFFCKTRDPLYLRIEKLDIMVKLATTTNYQKILAELREYATDVDVDFVRRAVRAIGSLAIRLEAALTTCSTVLADLLRLRVSHLSEECTIVYRDLLRAYPHTFSIETFSLCADGEYLHAVESKAALVWIVGQYAAQIPDAAEYLANMSETMISEDYSVQLSLLTAAVKVSVVRGIDCGLVDQVLRRCLHESTSPDVRSRAQMYMRLLEHGEGVVSKVVMAPLPAIGEPTMDKEVVENLLSNLGHVSCVYHLPSWAVTFKDALPVGAVREKEQADASSSDGDLLDISDADVEPANNRSFEAFGDEFGSAERSADFEDDLFASFGQAFRFTCKDEVVLPHYQQGSNGQMGLQVIASLYREDEKITFKLALTNKTSGPISLQAIQFNKNSFGLSPASALETPVVVSPDKTTETHVPLAASVVLSNTPPANPIALQVAIKTNVDVFYFRVYYELPIVLAHGAKITRAQFEELWGGLQSEDSFKLNDGAPVGDRLSKAGLSFVGSGLSLGGLGGRGNECYFAVTTNSLRLLAVFANGQGIVKAEAAALIPLFRDTPIVLLSAGTQPPPLPSTRRGSFVAVAHVRCAGPAGLAGRLAQRVVVRAHGLRPVVLLHVPQLRRALLLLQDLVPGVRHADARLGVLPGVPFEAPLAGPEELLELLAVALEVQHRSQLRDAHLQVHQRHDVEHEPPHRVPEARHLDEGPLVVGHRLERGLPELVEHAVLHHAVHRDHRRDHRVLLRRQRDLRDADVEVAGRQLGEALQEDLLDDDWVGDMRVQRVNLEDSDVVAQAVGPCVGHLLVQELGQRLQPADAELQRRRLEDGLGLFPGFRWCAGVHLGNGLCRHRRRGGDAQRQQHTHSDGSTPKHAKVNCTLKSDQFYNYQSPCGS
ncbi:beta adaptin [Babesia caballi]|uniref:Beta adaptin n=1 Tax=Babesia caballi TaxID=5871 RepID=A0AAV4LMD8_BABCB|nr:beta adaptin [Babesia caballi]